MSWIKFEYEEGNAWHLIITFDPDIQIFDFTNRHGSFATFDLEIADEAIKDILEALYLAGIVVVELGDGKKMFITRNKDALG